MANRTRQEEGQVYPALLLAVIGGFAIATAFLGIQNLLDQTGRAASASDSAALAVGKGHQKFTDQILRWASTGLLPGQYGALEQLMSGSIPNPALQATAEQFARANGAQVVGAVRNEGFNLAKLQWKFEVTTKQVDEVKGGDSKARTESVSHVTATVTDGLCRKAGVLGVDIGDGDCKNKGDILKDCVTTPSPMPYCAAASIPDLMRWEIRLVQ